jgi:hypothetical protein
VRLFFDEDRGKAVAVALNAVHVPTYFVADRRMPVRKGTRDEDWIPLAGRLQWLVITANKAILEVEAHRSLWLASQVGGVFLTTNQLRSIDELRLLLRKLRWLETIDQQEKRPFAFMLSPNGRTRKVADIG